MMTTHASTPPLARGRLSTTSLAELLVLSLERRLNGSFVFETPVSERSALVVASGRVTKVRTAETVDPLGRLLTDSGVIDDATLERGLRVALERKDRLGDVLIQLDAVERSVLERTLREQIGRRLSWLGQLPEESAYGFYANVDFLEDRPECGVEPLALIWRCMRDGRALHPGQEAALAGLGARPLRLRERAALERFELSSDERALFEGLRSRPLSLEALVNHPGLEATRARRLIYALLITHQLDADRRPSSAPPERPLPSLAPPGVADGGSSRSSAPDRVEHALERASRLVRERARAEGAAEAAVEIEAARASMDKKQFAEAEKHALAACNLDTNAEHLAFHAWLRMQNGDLAMPALAAQVLAALDRAVMKAPTSVTVRFQRAQVLKRLGRDEDAYKDFRFVARRAPDHLDAVREVRLHLMRTRNKTKQSGVFSKLFLR
jgi:tetratricopeptide (TPR) repeat protein